MSSDSVSEEIGDGGEGGGGGGGGGGKSHRPIHKVRKKNFNKRKINYRTMHPSLVERIKFLKTHETFGTSTSNVIDVVSIVYLELLVPCYQRKCRSNC